jgi:hypothetical protein
MGYGVSSRLENNFHTGQLIKLKIKEYTKEEWTKKWDKGEQHI